jgi:hypothetical protein
MATVTNSRFLAILAPEPNINSGWSVRIHDYNNPKNTVAVVSEFTSMQFTQELNAVGTGSITLDQDSPFWSQLLNSHQGPHTSNWVLLDNEYIWEAWENNTPRFAWVAQSVETSLVGEDETRTVTISGPGIAQVLTWAVIHRPAWPTKVPIARYDISQADGVTRIPVYRANSYQDTVPAFNWRFPMGWPTMRMWYTVFKAAQRRGLIRWVNLMFGPLTDSGGKPWVAVNTLDQVTLNEGYQPDTPSENLLDFLNDCTGQDYSKWFGQRLEWQMHPGFQLDVRPTIGVDRSNSVRFFQGNLLSDSRTRDREAIFNRVMAVDVDGNETTRQDADSVATWTLREQRNETNKNVTDTNLRASLADRYIQQSKDEKDQWTIAIPYDDPGRIPYHDFNLGDWISVSADYFGGAPTTTATPTKYRVMAISISIASDQTVPNCELTLKSLIDLKQDDLQKQITQLINNPINTDLSKIKQIDGDSILNANDGDIMKYDAASQKWGAGTGVGGGGNMFVQSTNPALDASTRATVKPGDFWLETFD